VVIPCFKATSCKRGLRASIPKLRPATFDEASNGFFCFRLMFSQSCQQCYFHLSPHNLSFGRFGTRTKGTVTPSAAMTKGISSSVVSSDSNCGEFPFSSCWICLFELLYRLLSSYLPCQIVTSLTTIPLSCCNNRDASSKKQQADI